MTERRFEVVDAVVSNHRITVAKDRTTVKILPGTPEHVRGELIALAKKAEAELLPTLEFTLRAKVEVLSDKLFARFYTQSHQYKSHQWVAHVSISNKNG